MMPEITDKIDDAKQGNSDYQNSVEFCFTTVVWLEPRR
jgi:hypothetical protein